MRAMLVEVVKREIILLTSRLMRAKLDDESKGWWPRDGTTGQYRGGAEEHLVEGWDLY